MSEHTFSLSVGNLPELGLQRRVEEIKQQTSNGKELNKYRTIHFTEINHLKRRIIDFISS